jgi:hypothetical protein
LLKCALQVKDTPFISDRAIAGMLGVSDKTVGSVPSDMVAIAEIPKFDVTEGLDGKKHKKPIRTTFIDDTPNGQNTNTPINRNDKTDVAQINRLNRGRQLPS